MTSLILATVVAFSPAAHTSTSPQWQADYGKALEATRRSERPLLVLIENQEDVDASIDDQLVNQTQETLDAYHLCRVDASTEYGQKVAQRFGATKFPHTAIIDKEGAVVLFKKNGQFSEGEWKNTLKTYKNGVRKLVRATPISRQGTIFSSNMSDPNYCPSCQRQPMGF